MATATNHAHASTEDDATHVLGIESSFPDLLRLTEAVFEGHASIVIEADAELPAIRYAVVETTFGGSLEDVARRRHEWHHRVRQLLGDGSRHVRLSVDVQE